MKKSIFILLIGLLLLPSLVQAQIVPHHPAQCCFRHDEGCGQYEYLGERRVTEYGCEAYANGGYTTTSTGTPLIDVIGDCVATDSLPIGTRLYIKCDDGTTFYRTVLDRGCGDTLDILIDSEDNANSAWTADVWIIN